MNVNDFGVFGARCAGIVDTYNVLKKMEYYNDKNLEKDMMIEIYKIYNEMIDNDKNDKN